MPRLQHEVEYPENGENSFMAVTDYSYSFNSGRITVGTQILSDPEKCFENSLLKIADCIPG